MRLRRSGSTRRARRPYVKRRWTNEKLAKAWKHVAARRREYCTVHGKYTWKQVCYMMADALGRDGDWIVRKVYLRTKRKPVRLLCSSSSIADQLNDFASIRIHKCDRASEIHAWAS